MTDRLKLVRNAPVRRSAVVVVHDSEGRVLLLKRRDTDRAFGGWCLPGGTSEASEARHETAVRELQEEVPGLKVTGPLGDPILYCKSWSERSLRWYDIAVFKYYAQNLLVEHGDEHEAAALVWPRYALQQMELSSATRAALSAFCSMRTDAPAWPIAGQAPMLPDSPGLFGTLRRFDIHTGVDLYCEKGAPIVAMSSGVVISVEDFTGPNAEDPSPHWNDTKAVLVRSSDRIIVYGEIDSDLKVGDHIQRGELIGVATPVLKKNKGRPMVMLHLEMMTVGATTPSGTKTLWWKYQDEACTLPEPTPETLLDPTGFLYEAAGMHGMKHFSMSTYDGKSFIDPDAPKV